MKKVVLFIIGLLTFSLSGLHLTGQNNSVRPQLWNNLYVGWNASDKFALRGGVTYNVLLSDIAPWNEITASASAVFKFHRFMEATAGLYVAAAQQTDELRSYEYRPYLGYRIFTNDSKRWGLTNLSRFEMRAFRYSDKTTDLAFRFRNRTYAAVSLLQPSLIDDKNLVLFGYFEAFYNFEQEVRERFFNQFKYKLGFAYRLSYAWRFDIGMIYQDSRNNVQGPSQLPVAITTNWVIEWGIAYIIPPRK